MMCLKFLGSEWIPLANFANLSGTQSPQTLRVAGGTPCRQGRRGWKRLGWVAFPDPIAPLWDIPV